METVSCEAKKPLGRLRKNTTREDRLIGMNKKKDQFVTATTISKRANAKLCIKISRHTISRRLTDIDLNGRVAFTNHYISKKNKMKLI